MKTERKGGRDMTTTETENQESEQLEEGVELGYYRARVDAVEDRRISSRARVLGVHFRILKGRYRGRRLYGTFVFNQDWGLGRGTPGARDLSCFMKDLGPRYEWPEEGAPAVEVEGHDLVGAVGTANVGFAGRSYEPAVQDFRDITLQPKAMLRLMRVGRGVEVDDETLEKVQPGGEVCPICLRKVEPGNPVCPNPACKLDLADFYADHCPRCLSEADPLASYCYACGAPLAGTERTENPTGAGEAVSG